MGAFAGFLAGSPFGLKQGQKSLNAFQSTSIPQGEVGAGDALNYYLSILHGGRGATEAIAPELNAFAGQTEAEKRRLASEGTARGGGVNAAQQALGTGATSKAVDVLGATAPQAAGAAGSLGTTLTSQGTAAAATETSNALSQRAQNIQLLESLISDLLPGKSAPSSVPGPPAAQTPGQISAGAGGPSVTPTEEVPLPDQIPLESFA